MGCAISFLKSLSSRFARRRREDERPIFRRRLEEEVHEEYLDFKVVPVDVKYGPRLPTAKELLDNIHHQFIKDVFLVSPDDSFNRPENLGYKPFAVPKVVPEPEEEPTEFTPLVRRPYRVSVGSVSMLSTSYASTSYESESEWMNNYTENLPQSPPIDLTGHVSTKHTIVIHDDYSDLDDDGFPGMNKD